MGWRTTSLVRDRRRQRIALRVTPTLSVEGRTVASLRERDRDPNSGWSVFADEPKERSDLVDEEGGLLPGGEVSARGKSVVPAKVGVAPLDHAARRAEHLARENRHAGRHVDAVLVEAAGVCPSDAVEPSEDLPAEARRRRAGGGEPVQRNVVKQLIASQRVLRVTRAVGPRPHLLDDPRALGDERVGQRVAECLRPGRLQYRVAPAAAGMLLERGDVVE